MRYAAVSGTALILLIICGCGIGNNPNQDDNSFDADGIIWGTETYPSLSDASDMTDTIKAQNEAINNVLKEKNIKYRLYVASCMKEDGVFTADCALPSLSNPIFRFNLDETVKVFKENSWSMMPMISYCSCDIKDSDKYMSNYVAFVDWFVDRYKEDANIRYLELENCPNAGGSGAGSTQLDYKLLPKVQNKVYDAVKSKHPEILIGTPGFEYWLDEPDSSMVTQLEYFLDNNPKFDFWAFHPYPLAIWDNSKNLLLFPPTCSATENKYAGIPGILEIRKRLDEKGWGDRMIMDTEHDIVGPSRLTDPMDEAGAALGVQELILKRALKKDGRFVLSGIFALKIGERPDNMNDPGDFSFGSLNSDGSITKHLKAMANLISRLNEYRYAGHISGDYNDENIVWVEKLYADKKELYVIFKPFPCKASNPILLDGMTIEYTLKLSRKPSSVKIIDMYGNSEKLSATQSIDLQATNKPQYVEVTYKEDFDTSIGTYSTAGIAAADRSADTLNAVSSKKCGDGICDEIERANPDLCSKDC